MTTTNPNVAVIGTGYVGLTTGACLAHIGANVVCADIDVDKIERLERGEIPIFEAGLDEIVRSAVDEGRLSFVVGATTAARTADIIFLCLPTPQDHDGSADLSYVEAAAAEIADVLQPGAVVVNKSTVPVGSARMVKRVLDRPDVSVVSNPEFLREGSAVHDFLHPDRIVIGGDDHDANQRVAALYAPIDAPTIITDAASAETIKYAANGFLAIKISFANELAALCESVGADVQAVVAGVGSDERIGPRFLQPGPGWGGSCFPKDSRALMAIAMQQGYDFAMMRSAVSVNQQQRERMVQKIAAAAGRPTTGYRPLDGITVAVFGLTFKAGTDDLRESPALAIIERLDTAGASVTAFDPTVSSELSPAQRAHLGELAPASSAYDAASDADVVAVLTEWPEFRDLDFAKLASVMRGDAVVDARNVLDPAAVTEAGLSYDGVGRSAGEPGATA